MRICDNNVCAEINKTNEKKAAKEEKEANKLIVQDTEKLVTEDNSLVYIGIPKMKGMLRNPTNINIKYKQNKPKK